MPSEVFEALVLAASADDIDHTPPYELPLLMSAEQMAALKRGESIPIEYISIFNPRKLTKIEE